MEITHETQISSLQSDEILNELTFVSLSVDNADAVKEEMENEGQTFICDTNIYVEGHMDRVIIFGKKN